MKINEILKESVRSNPLGCLLESLGAPYEWTKDASSGRVTYQWQMPSTDDSARYGQCVFQLDDPRNNAWSMLFSINNMVSNTGGGDAFKIFATVIDCFKDWSVTEGRSANIIGFAANTKETSRVKLYDRFAKMMPSLGWTPDNDYGAGINVPDEKFYDFKRVENVGENYADGKKPGRKGLAKRSGVNCKQSVTKLRQIAKNSTGEKQRMAHWCGNMKAGKKK